MHGEGGLFFLSRGERERGCRRKPAVDGTFPCWFFSIFCPKSQEGEIPPAPLSASISHGLGHTFRPCLSHRSNPRGASSTSVFDEAPRPNSSTIDKARTPLVLASCLLCKYHFTADEGLDPRLFLLRLRTDLPPRHQTTSHGHPCHHQGPHRFYNFLDVVGSDELLGPDELLGDAISMIELFGSRHPGPGRPKNSSAKVRASFSELLASSSAKADLSLFASRQAPSVPIFFSSASPDSDQIFSQAKLPSSGRARAPRLLPERFAPVGPD